MNLTQYRIPKKIKIGGLTYTIEFPHVFYEDTDYLGLHSYDELTIKLGLYHHGIQVNRQILHSTFLHEVTHAIDQVYCARTIDNEPNIDRLANGLYQVILQNNLHLKDKKIPKRLKIGGYDVKVLYPFEFIDFERSAAFRPTTLHIKIERKDVIELAQMDLIGGILMMICENMNIRLGHAGRGEERVLDEFAFSHFQQGLYQVLVDNNIEHVIRGR